MRDIVRILTSHKRADRIDDDNRPPAPCAAAPSMRCSISSTKWVSLSGKQIVLVRLV